MTMKMTMAEFVGLEPCPFCGGEAALRMSWMEDGHRYRAVECVECGATTPGNYSEVGDQSAWDWNSRAERTCECVAEYAKSPIDGKTIVLHRCSACNELMRPHMNYCPNCGARRVGE